MRAALIVLGAKHACDADVGALSVELGNSLVFQGHADEAGPHVERALVVAEALELPDLLLLPR